MGAFDHNGSVIPGYAKPNLNSGLMYQSPTVAPSATPATASNPLLRGINYVGSSIGRGIDTLYGTNFSKGSNPGMGVFASTAQAATTPSAKTVVTTPPPPTTHVDVNAAQDALIKITQDKLKTLQGQLKTQQEGQANGTMDVNGNPIAPTLQPPQVGGQYKMDDQGNTGNNPNGANLPNYSPTNIDLGTVASDEANVAKTKPTADAQAGLMKTAQQSADEKAASDALMGKFQTASPEYQAATANANAYDEALKQSRINEAHGLTANSENPISLDSMTGRSLILQNQYGLEQGALSNAYNAATAQQNAANTQQSTQQGAAENAGNLANTQQAQQQAGFNQAGQLAQGQQTAAMQGLGQVAGFLQPTQVAPANTLTNPLSGQPVGGGQVGGINTNAQNAVNTLTDSVLSGSISYQDAVNQLSGFGPNAPTALLNAIKSKNPNFNVNQANAQSSAQEVNTQKAGEMSALVDKSNAILDTLPAKFDKLSDFQKTGGSLVTDIANNFSNLTGLGATNTQDYVRTLSEAKATVQSILSSAVNLGVSTGGKTADSLLPMNMSKEGITTAIATIKDIQEKTKQALAKLSNASGGSSSNSFSSNKSSSDSNSPGGLYSF